MKYEWGYYLAMLYVDEPEPGFRTKTDVVILQKLPVEQESGEMSRLEVSVQKGQFRLAAPREIPESRVSVKTLFVCLSVLHLSAGFNPHGTVVLY